MNIQDNLLTFDFNSLIDNLKQMNQFTFIPTIFTILIFSLLFTIQIVYSQTSQIPTISTREQFDTSTGEKIDSENTEFDIFNSELFEVMGCPPQVLIYIHGVWVGDRDRDRDNSIENSDEVFNRLLLSLQENNYLYPLIGYSWDSDTPITPQGWNMAKQIATQNGPILGGFIKDYKLQCPTTEIRLVAHSLGARVVLESINYLDNNQDWNNNDFNILSVNLLGAAINDNEISVESFGNDNNDSSNNSPYGDAIENHVVTFHNYYNTEDDVLEPDSECFNFICQPVYYPFYEDDLALGQSGSQSDITIPINYVETDVTGEIPFEIDADADGSCDLFVITPFFTYCTILREGDNHFGYIGVRSNNNEIIDDGVIDIMIENWSQ